MCHLQQNKNLILFLYTCGFFCLKFSQIAFATGLDTYDICVKNGICFPHLQLSYVVSAVRCAYECYAHPMAIAKG